MLWGDDDEYFDLSATSVPAILANSADGYKLEVTYTPSGYGEHKTTLIIQDGGMTGSTVIYLSGIGVVESGIIPDGVEYPDLYTSGKHIYFRSYEPNTPVYIYNIYGKQVFTASTSGDWESYCPVLPGVYLVTINDKTKKVIIE